MNARFTTAAGYHTPLPKTKVIVGVGPQAGIELPAGMNAAEEHAEIRPFMGGHILKHLAGDAFSTFVNGSQVDALTNLKPGDQVRFGDFEVQYELVDEEANEAAKDVEPPPIPADLSDPQALPQGDAQTPEGPSASELPASLRDDLSSPPEVEATDVSALSLPEASREDELPALPPLIDASGSIIEEAPQNTQEPVSLSDPSSEQANEPPPLPPGLEVVSQENQPQELPPLPADLESASPAIGTEALPLEMPPLPSNLEDASPAVGAESPPTELPPLPANLEDASPAVGAESPPTELPPLPANLEDASPAVGAESPPAELPPLPANLEDASPAVEAESPPTELPPLPANLEGASPAIGAEASPQELPPLTDELIEPEPEPSPSESASMELPPLDAGAIDLPTRGVQPASPDDQAQSGKITLNLEPEVADRETATRNKWREYGAPVLLTLLLMVIGIILLNNHNNKLRGNAPPFVHESSGPKTSEAASAEQEQTSAQAILENGNLEVMLGQLEESNERRPNRREFSDLNFAFNVPAESWKEMDADSLEGIAPIRLVNVEDGSQFFLVAERIPQSEASDATRLANGTRRLIRMVMPQSNVVDRGTHPLKGLTFSRYNAHSTSSSDPSYLIAFSLARQGFSYQLITMGHSGKRAKVEKLALFMVRRFELLDSEREQRPPPERSVSAFADAFYGYEMTLSKVLWRTWNNREDYFPLAHVAAESNQGSIFGAAAIAFPHGAPALEDLTGAFLKSMGIPYPHNSHTVTPLDLAGVTAQSIITRQPRDTVLEKGKMHTICLRVIRRDRVGYLLAGWTASRDDYHLREITKAMDQVAFTVINQDAPRPALSYGMRHGQAAVMHQLALTHVLREDLAGAAAYFEWLIKTHPGYQDVYFPAAETLCALGRLSDAKTLFSDLAAKRNIVKARVAQALIHQKAGEWEPSQNLYEQLFEEGYYDRLVGRDYLKLLLQTQQPGKAQDWVLATASAESAFQQKLWEATLANLQGEFESSIAILQDLLKRIPGDHETLSELAAAYLGQGDTGKAHALAAKCDAPWAAYLNAMHAESQERPQDQLRYLMRAARLDPSNQRFMTALIRALAPKPKPEFAGQDAEERAEP